MQKVKISIAAIAFVFAIGSTVASHATSTKVKAACVTTDPKNDVLPGTQQIECPGDDNVACCQLGEETIFRQS